MTRIEIKPSTFKKLYGLSGNRCAFNDPQCTQRLIDVNGNIVAQICHIEAAEPKGERYNPNQTDEDRRAFENLILLCSIHHTVTDDTQKYTVDILKEMKRTHEEKYLGNEQYVPDEISNKLIEKYNQQYNISNNSSGNQLVNTGSGIQNIHIGVTYTEAKDISLSVFKENYIKLSQEANEIAMRKIESFTDDFIDRLKNESKEIFNKLKEPHIQMSIFSTQKGYIGSGTENFRELYLDLLINRIRSDEQSLLQLSVEQAINVLPKLGVKHINAITLIYLIHHHRWECSEFHEFEVFMKTEIVPLINNISKSREDYSYMEHTGCIISSLGLGDFINDISKYDISLFTRAFTLGEFMSKAKSTNFDHLMKFIEPVSEEDANKAVLDLTGTYKFKPLEYYDLEDICKTLDLQEDYYYEFRNNIQNTFNIFRVNDCSIVNIDDFIPVLIDIWNNTRLKAFYLNTVGKIIAITNYNSYSQNKLDLQDILS